MDLIDRQAAIDAIEGLPNCYNGFSDSYDKSYIIGVLEELPSAEPVIRCKDCKYWNSAFMECEGFGNWFGLKDEWNENGFCYKAERRDNE